MTSIIDNKEIEDRVMAFAAIVKANSPPEDELLIHHGAALICNILQNINDIAFCLEENYRRQNQ